jgi:branched-chain amino acid transport system substrate-binding protein
MISGAGPVGYPAPGRWDIRRQAGGEDGMTAADWKGRRRGDRSVRRAGKGEFPALAPSPCPSPRRREGTLGRSFGAWIAAAAILAAAAQPARAGDPIEIGMAVALTGSLASADGEYVTGVKLGVERANAAGGIDGHKLELHILDNASNATTAVTVTNQLFNQFNVAVMMNGASSAASVAIHPIAQRNKVPFFTISQLPPQPVWAFIAINAYQKVLELQLQFAKQQLHATKVAFLYSQTPYGQNGAKLLAKRGPELGFTVVYSEGAEGSSTDLTPQMAKIRDAQPDVVIDFLTGPVHIVEAKAAATVGLHIPLITGNDDTIVTTQAEAAYPNSYFVTAPVQAYPDIPDPELKAAVGRFLDAFKAAGLDPANVWGAGCGWDAVNILTKAVTASHATGGEALRAAIEKTEFIGATTRYKFSAADHTGQDAVPNSLQIGQYQGKTLKIFAVAGQ